MSRVRFARSRSPLASRLTAFAVVAALITPGPGIPVATAADLIPTTLTLAAPETAPIGEPVTFTATVTPDPGGGHLTFYVDNQPKFSTAVPPGGVVTWTLDAGFTYYGQHVVLAIVTASATHDGSADQAFVDVPDDRIPVTVSLTSSPNPVLRGDAITFQVSVSPNPHGGEVQLVRNGSSFADGELGGNGEATIEESIAVSGSMAIVACFVGNEAYQQTCSPPIDQVVFGIESTTTLAIEPATVYPDESITIDVTVAPAPETATTVWIGTSDDDHRIPIGVSGPSGHTQVTLTPAQFRHRFALGTQYDLRAYFPGTMQLEPSTSNLVQLQVRLDEAALSTDVEAVEWRVGEPLTFSASVTPLPIVESAGVGFFVTGPPESGFGDHVGLELGLDGTGETIVDTDGWPAGDYWYEAACCGDPHLAQTTERGVFTLIDEDAPTGGIAVADGRSIVANGAVVADVPATDGVGSGVQVVALSNDGAPWSTMPYDEEVDWTLTGGDGVRTVRAKWRDQAGNWSAIKTDTIVLDTTAPVVTGLRRLFTTGSTITAGTVPIRLSWRGQDATSGVARYELQRRTDGGTWVTVSTALRAPSAARSLPVGAEYGFRLRAIDKAGNPSGWATTTGALATLQESSIRLAYSGSWSAANGTAYWGSGARAASTAGASVQLSFTGRSVAWVSRAGPDRGRARVYVDGVMVATVDLSAPSYQDRQIAWAGNWTTSATRTVRIVVEGTSGRPRVDVDAFVTQ